MQKMRLAAAGLLSGLMVLSGSVPSAAAQADSEISLVAENISDKRLTFEFNQNQANCTVFVNGKAGTAKITGTLKLYDETTNQTVQSWTESRNSRIFQLSKTAAVKSGHRYTLSFSGSVYDADNKEEKVSISTVKTN